MSDEILKVVLDKVEKMEHKISNAQSMNGGFDKLLMEVEHIKENQATILEGVRGVKQNLYEPDSGLFSRVKELETESERRKEFILESKPALEFSKELVVWKRQADKELEEFEKLQMEFEKLKEWKHNMSRVIWLIATAAGGMWVKHFMDLMMK
jgi:FtsZ-binding cell division protein ZapB